MSEREEEEEEEEREGERNLEKERENEGERKKKKGERDQDCYYRTALMLGVGRVAVLSLIPHPQNILYPFCTPFFLPQNFFSNSLFLC